MKQDDYEQTLLSIKNLSMEDLYQLMHDTDDDFLAYKIKHLLHCLQHVELFEQARHAQLALLAYIEHAFQRQTKRELDELGDFFQL